MDNVVFISEEMNDMIKNSELKPRDILLAKTGATIGKTAIVPEDLPRSNTTSHVGKITLPSNHCPEYFYYMLTSAVVQDQIQDLSAMQSTRPELGIDGMKNLKVIVPPLEEQSRIASYLDVETSKIDGVVKIKRNQLDRICSFKKSFVFEYVTGKKRVKEAM